MRRRLGLSWIQAVRVDAAAARLAQALLAALVWPGVALGQAQPGVELVVEPCAGAPFDVEAYAKALDVELKVLNAASLVPGSAPEGASGPQLVVALPGCGNELQVTLRVRGRDEREGLRASDYAGVGQPRALALATIEALRVLSLRVQAPQPAEETRASAPEATAPAAQAAGGEDPAPSAQAVAAAQVAAEPDADAPDPAEPDAAEEPAPRSERSPPSASPPWLALHARAGLGAWSALDAHVHAGAALALSQSVWAKAELGYGQALARTALGALRAHQVLVGALLELRTRPFASIELWVASGLRAGLTVVSAELELALAPGLRVNDALAPVLYAPLELGAVLDSGAGFVLGVFVEPGVWLAGATFAGPSAADLATTDDDADRPRLDLAGPSLQAGLILGYRF